jgi:hypothetical protein
MAGALIDLVHLYRRWHATVGDFPPAQARFSLEGFGQRNGFGPVRLKRWCDHHQVELFPIVSRRYHLRVTSYLSRSVFPIKNPVDLEFETSAQNAKQVEEQVARWKRAATEEGT